MYVCSTCVVLPEAYSILFSVLPFSLTAGLGRDSDAELYAMFKHWVDTLDDAQTVIDYSDYLPPVVGG